MSATLWVAKEVGVKKDNIGEKKEPWWKRRFESDKDQSEKGYQQAGKGKTKRNWRKRKEKD